MAVMPGRWPLALIRAGYRRPWLVLGAAVVVMVSGVLLGTRLTFETDVFKLMPADDPAVKALRVALEDFGSLDTLLVAITVDGEENLERSLALADAVGDSIRQSPYLERVEVHLEDPVKLADAILRHAVLFLDEDGLRALESRLSDAGLRARAADIRASLDAPHGMVAKELGVRDPLGFLPLLLDRVNRTPAALKVDYASGYFLAGDHSLVLLLAKPKQAATNIDFDKAMFADLEARVADVKKRMAEEEDLDSADLSRVSFGGGHRIALEDATLIRSDIIANSFSSMAGVLFLFYLAYRRTSAIHLAFLPLGVGLAMTFMFTALALGRLNSATSGFAALLIGLGIDFTIVMYGRYLEGRHWGLSVAEALDDMGLHSAPAVALGALTTVGTFYAFLATRFVGLKEFGLLTGTGIVFMALSAYLILPALVAIVDRKKLPPPAPAWLTFEPLLRLAARKARFFVICAVVLTIASVALLWRLRFDDDVRNLRSPHNTGVTVQEQIAKAFGLSFNAMMIRIEGKDEEAVLASVNTLAQGLDDLRARGVVSSYESIASLVPPRAAQERSLAWLAARPELCNPERVAKTLEDALRAQGLVVDAFASGIASMRQALRPAGPVSLEIWRGTPVQDLVERSLRSKGDKVATVVNVYSPPGKWRREAPPELVSLVGTIDGATLAGINTVAQRLRQMVWRDSVVAGLLGLFLVLVILLLDFRRVGDAMLCLLPVMFGVVWTLAIMALIGYPLNFLNVFVITMIIGVGSDYAIHMLHRLQEGADLPALAGTARAVVLSALTTIVGFGSLVTTNYPGLQSMGWMASLGVLFSCLGAIIVLPLLVRRNARP